MRLEQFDITPELNLLTSLTNISKVLKEVVSQFKICCFGLTVIVFE